MDLFCRFQRGFPAMVFWVAASGTVAVWLWLFPPEGISRALRAALLTLACLVTLTCTWGMVRAMGEMNKARIRAQAERRRLEAEKERAIRQIREENAEPYGRY
jgi:hypothetical protein